MNRVTFLASVLMALASTPTMATVTSLGFSTSSYGDVGISPTTTICDEADTTGSSSCAGGLTSTVNITAPSQGLLSIALAYPDSTHMQDVDYSYRADASYAFSIDQAAFFNFTGYVEDGSVSNARSYSDRYTIRNFLSTNDGAILSSQLFRLQGYYELAPGTYTVQLPQGSYTYFANDYRYFMADLTSRLDFTINDEAITPPSSGMTPTPEPTSWAMTIGGLSFVGGAMRRRQRKGSREPSMV